MNAPRLIRTVGRVGPRNGLRRMGGGHHEAPTSGPQHIHKHPVSYIHVLLRLINELNYFFCPLIYGFRCGSFLSRRELFSRLFGEVLVLDALSS